MQTSLVISENDQNLIIYQILTEIFDDQNQQLVKIIFTMWSSIKSNDSQWRLTQTIQPFFFFLFLSNEHTNRSLEKVQNDWTRSQSSMSTLVSNRIKRITISFIYSLILCLKNFSHSIIENLFLTSIIIKFLKINSENYKKIVHIPPAFSDFTKLLFQKEL
jgi:hypothetical protein